MLLFKNVNKRDTCFGRAEIVFIPGAQFLSALFTFIACVVEMNITYTEGCL